MSMSLSACDHRLRAFALSTLAASALLAGCKSKPAVDDATLNNAVQSQLAADAALSGVPVQPTTQNAVVTLNGTVANDAQRTLAGRDAAGVSGVKQVVNQLSLAASGVVAPSQTAAVVTAPPAPIVVKQAPLTESVPSAPRLTARERAQKLREERAFQQQQNEQQQQQARYNQPQMPAPIERPALVTAPPPPPPPPPAFRSVTVTSGTGVSVRVTQTLDSATAQPGDTFSGVLSADVLADGIVAIPAGSAVSGRVDDVHEAGHFKGQSMLTVSLNSISRRGERLTVGSDPYVVEGKGRGKNTAEKVGGGAAVGAILGGIFGGGKGAAIGAGAGGGLGAGAQAITRGQQVQIPSESIVRFHLTTPVTVRVRTDGGATGAQPADLQRRNNNY